MAQMYLLNVFTIQEMSVLRSVFQRSDGGDFTND